MGPGQSFLTRVGSGQFFVARVGFGSGQPFIVWDRIRKISSKNVKFFNFLPFGSKKIASGRVRKYPGQSRVGLGRVGSGPISTKNVKFFNFCPLAQKKSLRVGSKAGQPLIYCRSKISSGRVRAHLYFFMMRKKSINLHQKFITISIFILINGKHHNFIFSIICFNISQNHWYTWCNYSKVNIVHNIWISSFK